MAPRKSHENCREHGIHLHKWKTGMDGHGCPTKRHEFLSHHFFSLVKQWQRRLVHGQKMRGLYSFFLLFCWGFRNRSKWQCLKHEDFGQKRNYSATRSQHCSELIYISGWISLSLLAGVTFILQATPAAFFCYIPCGGNFSHRGIPVYMYSFKDSSRAACHAQKWQLPMKKLWL